MPIVNAYYREPRFYPALADASPAVQAYVAEQLTCGDRTLQPNEVTVRLLESQGKSMLTDVEIEIFAAPYKERVDKQDEICLNVKAFVLDKVPSLHDMNVWLILTELGHSWQEPA